MRQQDRRLMDGLRDRGVRNGYGLVKKRAQPGRNVNGLLSAPRILGPPRIQGGPINHRLTRDGLRALKLKFLIPKP